MSPHEATIDIFKRARNLLSVGYFPGDASGEVLILQQYFDSALMEMEKPVEEAPQPKRRGRPKKGSK